MALAVLPLLGVLFVSASPSFGGFGLDAPKPWITPSDVGLGWVVIGAVLIRRAGRARDIALATWLFTFPGLVVWLFGPAITLISQNLG